MGCQTSPNLYQPLDHGRTLLVAGKSCWVPFKYEKLPGMCFKCGRILHECKGCHVQSVKNQSHAEGQAGWGPWLWAEDMARGARSSEKHKEAEFPPPGSPAVKCGAERTRAKPNKKGRQNRDHVHATANLSLDFVDPSANIQRPNNYDSGRVRGKLEKQS
jgi:hypothetical protein